MRILVIVHQFLPHESAGTEVYTYNLAKALQARGHAVHLYFTHPGTRQYEMTRGVYDGLPYFAVVRDFDFGTFRGVYQDARMEDHLRTVLGEVAPDVASIQHLHLHSIDYLRILQEKGIPVVYTLAEYLNICLRNGWLVKLDFSLCEGPSPVECAKCAPMWPAPAREDALVPNVAVPAKRPRYSLRRFLRKQTRRLAGRPPLPILVPRQKVPPGQVNPWEDAVRRRWAEIKANLASVSLFVAPSRFLRDRFVASGMIESQRIVVSDYGFDHSRFVDMNAHRTPSDKMRLGFIGSFAEQKGVHLLIQALDGLPVEGLDCQIWGALDRFPEYVRYCKGVCRHPGVRFMGAYDNRKIAAVLGGLDVVVVPSRWVENSPLTIKEAFMAGLPVIAADRGGMAEQVQHGENGLLFRIGSADDLRRQIGRLLDEPELLTQLRRGIPPVKSIEEDARAMEERFLALRSGALLGEAPGS